MDMPKKASGRFKGKDTAGMTCGVHGEVWTMNMDLLKQKRADYFARKLSKINASLAASRARGPVQNEGEENGAAEIGRAHV